MSEPTCAVEECERGAKRTGLCPMHYQRKRRHGSPTAEVRRYAPGSTCEADGCDEPAKARGYCQPHYMALWRHGDVGAERRPQRADTCTVEGCGRPHKAQGYCHGHYQRVKHHGSPGTAPLGSKRPRVGTCEGPECDAAVQADGLCAAHYEQKRSGKPLTVKREYAERGVPCQADGCDRPALSEGLCQTHYRRRLDGDPDWAREIPAKAPNGAGHTDKQGYRTVTVDGRPVREHIVMAERLLGRPLESYRDEHGRLIKIEEVHHLNGNRSHNVTDGPFVMDDRGRLRSGNLEVWSKAQPAGQEVGPKLDWALDLLDLYAAQSPLHAARLAEVAERLTAGTLPP